MAVLGGALAAGQRRLGALTGYAALADTGCILVAFSIDVGTSLEFFVSEDTIRKRRINRKPLGKGAGIFPALQIFVYNRNSHLMRGHTPVNCHWIAEAELLRFINSFD